MRFFPMSSDRAIIDAVNAAQNLLRQNLPPRHNLSDAAIVLRFRELVGSTAIRSADRSGSLSSAAHAAVTVSSRNYSSVEKTKNRVVDQATVTSRTARIIMAVMARLLRLLRTRTPPRVRCGGTPRVGFGNPLLGGEPSAHGTRAPFRKHVGAPNVPHGRQGRKKAEAALCARADAIVATRSRRTG